jgi:VWFA-related protein
MRIGPKAARFLIFAIALSSGIYSQKTDDRNKQNVHTVTIPISIFTKRELRKDQAEEFIQIDRLIVKEDHDEQTILSVRSISNSPLSIAILIQEDLSTDFNLQLRDLKTYINALPRGTRVMVGYIRGGTLRVRQRFTDNLEKAATALQIVGGNESANGPYDGVLEAANLFDSLPNGRRAILLVSDGIEGSRGTDAADILNAPELERAILRAQRKSIAVYSIYSPTAITQNASSFLASSGQSALAKLSDETGGRTFYQGTIAPVSFLPFFKDLDLLLERQFVLTYLSTHMNKGYHRIEVTSTNPEVKIEHPKGYYYR